MIRTYTIQRPMFLDGGRLIEEQMSIMPSGRVYWSNTAGAYTRILDREGAMAKLIEWQTAGRDIRYSDSPGA